MVHRQLGAVAAADVVSALARKARIKTVPQASDLRAEPQYRPSAPMTRFIRCRDLTCRWPGCSVPAEWRDIDHTVPHPVGPTHPSNCELPSLRAGQSGQHGAPVGEVKCR